MSPETRAMQSLLKALASIPVFMLVALTAGMALAPALLAYDRLSGVAAGWSQGPHYLWLGVTVVLCYFIYGFALILIAPLFNLVLGGRLKPWRGRQASVGALPWFIHAAMTLLPRLSFLEFICPTPYLNFYYRLMGMKMGHNVTINTTAIADPSLIELGDKVTLGGSCSLMAHYAQGGFLVIAPVKIGAGATIGLRAIIMGGVTIGEKAKVLAGSFVLPKTTIPAGETWGGIPATRIDLHTHKDSLEV